MSKIDLAQQMQGLTVGRKLDLYTGVIIHAGQNSGGKSIDYSAGNTSGYVLELTNPIGTQAMAETILAGLRLRGIRYQPFAAEKAVLDPAAELGDVVTVNGTTSVLFSLVTRFSHLMAADASAPYDEEVDHEFRFEPKTTREFKRESAYTRSRLTINADAITAEVVRATGAEAEMGSRISLTADAITAEVTRATSAEGSLSSRITATAEAITTEVSRATAAEGSLSSRITQTETDISAKVSKTGGAASSFGWTLTDSSWTIYANSNTVLKATSAGVEINGKIVATSGVIGGVVIENGTLSGIADANLASRGISGGKIKASTISGGSGGHIVAASIDTSNTSRGINGSLGFADFSDDVFNNRDTARYCVASNGVFGTLSVGGYQFLRTQITYLNAAGTPITKYFLVQ